MLEAWVRVAAPVQPVDTTQGGTGAALESRAPVHTGRPPSARRDTLRRRLLFVADLLCLLTAVGAMTLVEGTTDPLYALIPLPLWILLAKAEGLYDADHPKIWHRTTDEATAIFHWITLSVAGSLFFLRALPDETLTVDAAAAMYVVALGGAFVYRAGARALWRRLVPAERALVLGSGQLADQVTRKLALEPGHHLVLRERASGEAEAVPGNGQAAANGHPVEPEAMTREALVEVIRDAEVERVILAIPELDEATLARVVSACRALGVKLSVMPPMRAMLGTAVQLTHIAEMPVIEYGTWTTTFSTMAFKRATDIVVSAVGLVVLAPVMLVIAVLVRVDSKGPGAVQPAARRAPRKAVQDAQVPHDVPRRGGAHLRGGRGRRASRSRCTSCATTRGSRAWGGCCAARASTSCLSCSTCCAAT